MPTNDTRGLWRGKRLNNGEWVTGVRCAEYIIIGIQRAYGDDEVAMSEYPEFDYIEVAPSTRGECTGLTDKNGKLIFEGDIVKTKYGRLCVITWFSSSDFVGFDLNPIEDKHSAPTVWDLYESENLEIIGNIHDNPKLLKRESIGQD